MGKSVIPNIRYLWDGKPEQRIVQSIRHLYRRQANWGPGNLSAVGLEDLNLNFSGIKKFPCNL